MKASLKSIFLILILVHAFYCSTIAQEKVPPWIIIPRSEVPDSIFNQEQIDEEVEENWLEWGEVLRYVYYVKLQLDSVVGIEGEGGHDYTYIEMPREPDSTEIVEVRMGNFNLNLPPNGFSFLTLYAVDYGSTSITVHRFNEGSDGFGLFTIGITPMPAPIYGRSFKGNKIYGYLIQNVSSHFPPLSTKDQIENLAKIKCFPNPTNGSIHLDWEDNLEVSSIEVFDQTGKFIFSKPIVNNADQIQMDLSTLVDGFYTLVIRNEQGLIVGRERVVKMN